MEVIIHSTIVSTPGQVTVATDSDQPIDNLIIAFCIDRGLQHNKDLVLRDSQHRWLENTKKISFYDIKNGEVLYLSIKADTEDVWPLGCNQWWLLASVALLIAAVGLVAVSLIYINGKKQPHDYGVVIDAGSSHSQLFVYRWEADKENNTAIATQIYTCKSTGSGISTYTSNPKDAGASLQPCLDNAKKYVPASLRRETPIFLGATAGMRLLRESDNQSCTAIMASVRETLSATQFNFSSPKQQARIIDGQEEGSFSWVTVNFLSKKFGKFTVSEWLGYIQGKQPDTLGALDLGGASTQITFIPADVIPVPGYYENLLLYGQNYNVYTHSYLCYGVNEAVRQFKAQLVKDQNFSKHIENPCGPKGNETSDVHSDIFEVPCTKKKKVPTATLR